ncbi:hypothetical protein KY290_001337 [Solanum tuberosum]|uniref:Uncharacterized protein n=1 Tax=Solanum tuberosum TaxID=4113 RepID=A0ABQ7WNY0_SOLTU|nr:hypothetical protein KY290_001337 [Solanum tuberosum]
MELGLIGAVKDLFLEAEHRNCVRHMYQNFKQKHKGKALKDLVWNTVTASNKEIFHKCMKELYQEDKAAREWFNNPERPFQSWTRALIRTNTKCDMLLNNFCEGFKIERVEDYVDTFYTIETFKNVYSYYINPTNLEDHLPKVVDCGEVIPPKIVKKNRGRKPKSRKKEPKELEKKTNIEAIGKAEKRAEQKSEKRRPQKLSKKGYAGYVFDLQKAISPAEEASNDGDYLNMYRLEMWNNNHQGLNLAYQSIITQAPIEEHVIVVQTDVVAAQGVDEVEIKGIKITRLSQTSKRGRLFKRKVMKEYIVEVQKKKKIGNHSKV